MGYLHWTGQNTLEAQLIPKALLIDRCLYELFYFHRHKNGILHTDKFDLLEYYYNTHIIHVQAHTQSTVFKLHVRHTRQMLN